MAESRRDFLRWGVAGLAAARAALAGAAPQHEGHVHPAPPAPKSPPAASRPSAKPPAKARSAAGYVSVETPDVPKLPWTWDGDVKVFHLIAEPVQTR